MSERKNINDLVNSLQEVANTINKVRDDIKKPLETTIIVNGENARQQLDEFADKKKELEKSTKKPIKQVITTTIENEGLEKDVKKSVDAAQKTYDKYINNTIRTSKKGNRTYKDYFTTDLNEAQSALENAVKNFSVSKNGRLNGGIDVKAYGDLFVSLGGDISKLSDQVQDAYSKTSKLTSTSVENFSEFIHSFNELAQKGIDVGHILIPIQEVEEETKSLKKQAEELLDSVDYSKFYKNIKVQDRIKEIVDAFKNADIEKLTKNQFKNFAIMFVELKSLFEDAGRTLPYEYESLLSNMARQSRKFYEFPEWSTELKQNNGRTSIKKFNEKAVFHDSEILNASSKNIDKLYIDILEEQLKLSEKEEKTVQKKATQQLQLISLTENVNEEHQEEIDKLNILKKSYNEYLKIRHKALSTKGETDDSKKFHPRSEAEELYKNAVKTKNGDDFDRAALMYQFYDSAQRTYGKKPKIVIDENVTKLLLSRAEQIHKEWDEIGVSVVNSFSKNRSLFQQLEGQILNDKEIESTEEKINEIKSEEISKNEQLVDSENKRVESVKKAKQEIEEINSDKQELDENLYESIFGRKPSSSSDIKTELQDIKTELSETEQQARETIKYLDKIWSEKELKKYIINSGSWDDPDISANDYYETEKEAWLEDGIIRKKGKGYQFRDDNAIAASNRKIIESAEEAAKAEEKLNDAIDKTKLSSDATTPAIEQQNELQEELKETKVQAKETITAIEDVIYHSGTISKLNKAETNGQFYGSNRGTGFFGTGHYFVDNNTKHEIMSGQFASKPFTSVDISQYDNLFKANTDELADKLHSFLANLTKYTQGSDNYNLPELFSQFEDVFGKNILSEEEFNNRLSNLLDYMSKSSRYDRGDSVSTQFMKSLGYGGVDTRGTKYADTRYGTVIYDLKEESILQANITDELQKQGDMLDKIAYKSGEVFDKSEDEKIQGILDKQSQNKAILDEYNRIFDSTSLNQADSELETAENRLREIDNIIDECRHQIDNAEQEVKSFNKEMAAIGLSLPEEELQSQIEEHKKSYQERIDELSVEKKELESQIPILQEKYDLESKLSNEAYEQAKNTVLGNSNKNGLLLDTEQTTTALSQEGKVGEIAGEQIAEGQHVAREEIEKTSRAVDEQKNKFAEYSLDVAFGKDRYEYAKELYKLGYGGGLLREPLHGLGLEELKSTGSYDLQKANDAIFKKLGIESKELTQIIEGIVNASGGYFKNTSRGSADGDGWIRFSTYSGDNVDSKGKVHHDLANEDMDDIFKADFKVYAQLENVANLNKDFISEVLEALSLAGFKGSLKTIKDSSEAYSTDQVVIHGSTVKDQEIAYNVLRNQFASKLSYLGAGFDPKMYKNGKKSYHDSFTQLLSNGLEKNSDNNNHIYNSWAETLLYYYSNIFKDFPQIAGSVLNDYLTNGLNHQADLSEFLNQSSSLKSELSNKLPENSNIFDEYNLLEKEVYKKIEDDEMTVEDAINKMKTFVGSDMIQRTIGRNSQSNESDISTETQTKQNEELAESIFEVYRAYNKMNGIKGEKGISWFSSDFETMMTYLEKNPDRELIKGNLDFSKLLNIDAQGALHNAITYLGDGSDEASVEITNLYNRIQDLKSSLEQTPNDALQQELHQLELEYDKLSEDTSNLYGTHTTNWFAIQAQEAGYLGVAIKNVIDDYDGLIDKPSTTIALFDIDQLKDQKRITDEVRGSVEQVQQVIFDTKKAIGEDVINFVDSKNVSDLQDELREVEEFNSLMKLTEMTAEELGSSLREVFAYAHENPDVLNNLYDYDNRLVDVFDENTNIGKYFKSMIGSTNFSVDESDLNNIYTDIASKLQEYERNYISQVISKLHSVINTDSTKQDLFQESSGQMAFFDGIVEKEKEIQSEIKETNGQIEGQLSLFDSKTKPIVDTDISSSADKTSSSVNKEENVLEELDSTATKAAKSKNKVAEANKDLAESADKTSNKVESEKKELSDIDKAFQHLIDTEYEYQELEYKTSNGTEGSSKKIAEYRNLLESRQKDIDLIGDEIDSNDRYSNALKEAQLNAKKLVENLELSDAIEKFNKLTIAAEKYIDTSNKYTPDSISNLESVLEKANIFKENGGLAISSIDDINEHIFSIENAINSVNKSAKKIEIDKLLAKVSKEFYSNTAMSKDLAKAYDEIIQKLKAIKEAGYNINSDEINTLKEQAFSLRADLEASGKTGKSFTKRMFDDLKSGSAQILRQYLSLQDIIRYGREALTVVKDLDTALTEMRKVSDEPLEVLKNYQTESFDVAKEIGTTALQLQQSTADWMRLGESITDAAESAKTATVLLNVSEFENINDATQSLVSASQAYKELDKMEIVDVLNNIGNNYSVSTDQLAQGLQNAAAVLKTQGNDLNEAVALLTAGNAITQDISKTSAGIRTISLRIAGTEEAKEELAELGEDVEDYVVATSAKKREIIKDFTSVASNGGLGVDILDENGNLKNTYEIMLAISKVYKEIQEEDKRFGTNRAQGLVEELAGKNRSNIAASILNNPELLESVYNSAQNSQGSAEAELEKYLDSIEGRIAKFKTELQEMFYNLIDTDFVKNAIDVGTEFISGLSTGIQDLSPLLNVLSEGLLGIAKIFSSLTEATHGFDIALAGAFLAFKKFGRGKCNLSFLPNTIIFTWQHVF